MPEKRYYWLKLKEDFFSSKRIKRLRNLAGGDTYTIIYLKMQLKSLKTDGFLYFDGLLDSFSEELALDIDESPDNVKVTVNYLLSCGLLETNDDNAYKLKNMDNEIGSETAHTQRQRDYVARQKERRASLNDGQASFNDASVTKMLRGGDAEIEIEKEIEIDKEKDKQKEKDGRKSASRFSPPTLSEVQAYCGERGNRVDAQRFVDYYAANGWRVGKNPMKDWRAAVRTWERQDDGRTGGRQYGTGFAPDRRAPQQGAQREFEVNYD